MLCEITALIAARIVDSAVVSYSSRFADRKDFGANSISYFWSAARQRSTLLSAIGPSKGSNCSEAATFSK